MTVVQQGMQALLVALKEREPRIKRGAYLSALRFSSLSPDNSFSVTGYWILKGGGEYTKTFSPENVFSYSGTAGVRIYRTPCRFADDVIREILTARGI